MISMCSIPKEAAAEAEAECDRAFRFKRQRCVIELQFFKRVTQIGIFGAVLGVNTAEPSDVPGDSRAAPPASDFPHR